jgi:hypothetical protein
MRRLVVYLFLRHGKGMAMNCLCRQKRMKVRTLYDGLL